MTEVLEHVGGAEDALFGPRVERDPPPTFATPTNNYTYRQWKRDNGLLQAMTALSTHRQGRLLLRQVKGESRAVAEVVMDEVFLSTHGIDL